MFSASLLSMNCNRAGISAHGDGSAPASADSAVVPGGADGGSGGVVMTGSGGTPIGGASGTGGAGEVSTGPVGADGLLYGGATEDLKVSPDEHHVAFMRDYLPLPPCSTTYVGSSDGTMPVGTLLVATLADDGTMAVRVVGEGVPFSSVGFSADSRSIVFVDGYDACSLGGVLKTAASDGTKPRTLASVPINFDEMILGNALLFATPVTGVTEELWHALWLPDGAPMLLPGPLISAPEPSSSHDGRQLAYFDFEGAVHVLDVSTGASHQVDPGINLSMYNTSLVMSNAGSFLALATSYPLNSGYGNGSIAIVAANGSQATTLANDYATETAEFSPDSSQIAYDALNGSTGAPEIVVHPLAGGTDVHIQGLPDLAKNGIELSFTPDGARLCVTTRSLDATIQSPSLYVASANADGSLQLITSHLGAAPAFPPGDSSLAVDMDSGYTEVFSITGTISRLLLGRYPVYEPNSQQPRLLLTTNQSTDQAFGLAATDGLNQNVVYLPSASLFWAISPQWMGHSVVYGVISTTPGDLGSIYTYSGNSSNSTLLAAAPDTYAWAPIPAPTRLFYARKAANSAGPAGLWMVSIP